MKLKTDVPFMPENIRSKINELQSLLDQAADLRSDICDWYDGELKSYDPKVSVGDELFDPAREWMWRGSITWQSWNPCQN